jgi:transposase-like protein
MYMQGVSTRKVTEVMRELCGRYLSSTQVSRATKLRDEQLGRSANCRTCFSMLVMKDPAWRLGNLVRRADGFRDRRERHRTMLGVSISLSEAEVRWRDFFAQLQERGISAVRLLISDDHAGMKAAREAWFPSGPWQRCHSKCRSLRPADQNVPRRGQRSACHLRTT